MRRPLRIFACLTVIAVFSLAGAAAVMASGTGTSAGDQQYVDPLTTTTPAPTTSTGSSTLSQSPPATLSSGSSTTTTPSTTAAQSTGTLPYTGMNVWACAAVGVGLLGCGLGLRRIVRSH